MSNALAKKQEAHLPMPQAPAPQSDVLKSDVLIPMVLLMQGLSELVAEGKAVMGDFVRSTNGEKIGSHKDPIEFIPLATKNFWAIMEKVGQKFEFRKMIPRRAVVTTDDARAEVAKIETDKEDENLPWEFQFRGTQWKRVKLLNVFALLPKDIKAFEIEVKKAKETGEMPDLDKTLMPVVIPFRNTSFNAGRKVATHFTKAAAMAHLGAKPHGFALQLSAYQDKNDKGTFYVYDVGNTRRLAKDELAYAEQWLTVLGQGQAKIHEADEGSPSEGGQF